MSRGYARLAEHAPTDRSASDAETQLRQSAAALGLALTDDQMASFRTYAELLAVWNDKFNLTAVTDYGDVLIRHFLDSLTVLQALPERSGRLLDVGSGAGFPGLPLRIAVPDLRVTLLESVGKKATFLHAVLDTLGITDVEVVLARAEDAAHEPQHREAYDYVTGRGVARLPVLMEYLLPFCATGGRVIAMKSDVTDELESARRAISVLGGKLEGVQSVGIPGLPLDRCLVVAQKVAPTPAEYPRRAGIPAKRPL